ncbi:transcription factor bHLH143-like [Cynara cardunculus var. scolymus]|uniref:Myc-type, basic helix-loop-helix (BHLH) domain-containing protein n=1 Tax=Cynara cardunculus var. scolymus TaxID=59895 RepID=A0A103XXE0_CYNCS|nr:transcription factor bHLH143-like [Cynara cardunculus var. scolymus]KVH98675.1 Myc-type, basic helix-loop-helix (bHLH) domain-containing protein [Cynara cardunculus var. scolymus]
MEKGFASWFQDQQIDWQSTIPNSSIAPFGLRHQLNVPSFGNTTDENPPVFAFAESKPEEPCGWFHGLPRCHPEVNPILKEQLPVPGSRATHEIQKKFLVFDQSNDRTTLIYSSAPIQYHLPKPQLNLNLTKEFSVIEKHEDIGCSNPFHDDGKDEGSEMHEDTDELRALLYSDDDEIDYSEDEEEQSTGHSPSTMTGFDRLESTDENGEEVTSSMGPQKRHKLDSGGYDVVDTASSGKSGINCSGEAEVSSCGGGVADVDVGSESFAVAGKRSRKENLRETIRILENLIPGEKNGKDAMMILDEAINYLRILKVKAKALGLDSF